MKKLLTLSLIGSSLLLGSNPANAEEWDFWSVDYSGDYHELRELDNHEVSMANRVPGIIVLKPLDE